MTAPPPSRQPSAVVAGVCAAASALVAGGLSMAWWSAMTTNIGDVGQSWTPVFTFFVMFPIAVMAGILAARWPWLTVPLVVVCSGGLLLWPLIAAPPIGQDCPLVFRFEPACGATGWHEGSVSGGPISPSYDDEEREPMPEPAAQDRVVPVELSSAGFAYGESSDERAEDLLYVLEDGGLYVETALTRRVTSVAGGAVGDLWLFELAEEMTVEDERQLLLDAFPTLTGGIQGASREVAGHLIVTAPPANGRESSVWFDDRVLAFVSGSPGEVSDFTAAYLAAMA